MKKYIQYKCTQCLRSVETLADITYVKPDLCNITKGCDGRLLPTGTTSVPSISATSVPVSHHNVIATNHNHEVIDPNGRGKVTIQTAFTTNNNNGVSILTGTEGQVVIGVRPVLWNKEVVDGVIKHELNQDTYDALPDFLDVLFDTTDTKPAAFTSYIFRQTQPFQTVSGKESGLEGKNLRYNVNSQTPDRVEVRVNGVLRNQGDGPDDYQIFDGDLSNGVTPNSIKFNTILHPSGITQVDVSVSKFTERSTLTLRFRKQLERIESRVDTGAYENIDYLVRVDPVGIPSKYQLYVMDLSANVLPLNTAFVPAVAQFEPTVDFANAFFLLALKPYTHIDRYNTVVVEFKNFDINNKVIIQYAMEPQLKVNTLNASVRAVGSVYPPLKFNKLRGELPIPRNIVGSAEQTVINNDIIVGPDV